MADDAGQEGFTVRDRRRRDDEPAFPAAQPAPAAPAAKQVRPSASADTEPPAVERPDTKPPIIGGPAPAPGERSLAGLFVMLASFALAAMGEASDAGGEAHVDPEQAAELIDLLMLLREKTEGHRTAEETQILEEIIYDLQLRWVNARKRFGH